MARLLHICYFSSYTFHYLARAASLSLVYVPSESPTATLGVSRLVSVGVGRANARALFALRLAHVICTLSCLSRWQSTGNVHRNLPFPASKSCAVARSFTLWTTRVSSNMRPNFTPDPWQVHAEPSLSN